MAKSFYVSKILKNEQQLIAEVQTDHTKFSVIYEYDSDLRENGLNVWVGLIGISIIVFDDLKIDMPLSMIDRYIQREISQAIVRELLLGSY